MRDQGSSYARALRILMEACISNAIRSNDSVIKECELVNRMSWEQIGEEGQKCWLMDTSLHANAVSLG